MPYQFFLSYSRQDAKVDDNTVDPHFQSFVSRLKLRVRQLTGNQNPGFVDTTSIQPGQEWPDALAEALRTAQAMVCLYSPAYFRSEYCGKEMQVFLDRRRNYITRYGGKKPANIIPVIWQPVRYQIPKTLPDIQYTNEGLDLEGRGVWKLGDDELQKDLLTVADQIAQRVSDATDLTPLPALDHRPRVAAMRSAFLPPPLPLPEFDNGNAPAGPDAVTFVYASSLRWDQWPWAPPEEHAVLYLATAVAKGKDMSSTQLVFDVTAGNLLPRLNELRNRNNIVILFVDGANLDISGLSTRLQEYDRPEHSPFATIVLINSNCESKVHQKANQLFSYFSRRPEPHFQVVEIDLFNSPAREEFSKRLADTLEQLRLTVVNDPAGRHNKAAPPPIVSGS